MSSRLAPLDNFYHKCKKEVIEKEIMTRWQWYDRLGLNLIDQHLDLLRGDHVSRHREIKQEKSEEKAPVVSTKREPSLFQVAQSKKQLEDISKNIIRMEPTDPIQMPAVDPEVRALLYKGVSFNGEGRKAYLRERNKMAPITRFAYPPISLWTHGWLQDKFPKDRLPMSDVPLPHRLRQIFRRNGVLQPEEVSVGNKIKNLI